MFRPRMLKAQCDQIRVHEFTVSAHVPAKRPLLIRKKKTIGNVLSLIHCQENEQCHQSYFVLMYHQILTTSVKGNVWQPVMRIAIPIHFPSNIRRLFGWPVVGNCIAVGLSSTKGSCRLHFAKHFCKKPCGLLRSRYVAVDFGMWQLTDTGNVFAYQQLPVRGIGLGREGQVSFESPDEIPTVGTGEWCNDSM